MQRKTFTLALITAALLATGSGALAQATIDHNKALAGNVTPGDGPGYPITLSRPGHYKLMGNLSVPYGTSGIVITADNVTLDMNGFTLVGPVTCTRNAATRVVACTESGLSTGIDVSGNGVVVRDGVVRGFGLGIWARGGETILRMHVTHNRVFGVVGLQDPHKDGMAVIDSLVDMNAQGGIEVQSGSAQVRGSRIVANGATGVYSQALGTVLVHGSVVRENRTHGLFAVAARDTVTQSNGTNREFVTSLGGNLDGQTPF